MLFTNTVVPFSERKGFTGSKKMLKVCPDVRPGSKEHYRPEQELRDVSMLSGVIRYGESESGVIYY